MAYFQIGILVVIGLAVFGIFMGFFIDLNKDASYHNRRQRSMKPKLSVIRTKRKVQAAKRPSAPNKPVQKKERRKYDNTPRGPRGPEKRK